MIFIKFYPMERFCLSCLSSRSETVNLKTVPLPATLHFTIQSRAQTGKGRRLFSFVVVVCRLETQSHRLFAETKRVQLVYIKPHYVYNLVYIRGCRACTRTHIASRDAPSPLRATCILISNIRYRVPTHQCAHGPPRTMHLHPMDRSTRFRPRLFRSFACRRMEGISGR